MTIGNDSELFDKKISKTLNLEPTKVVDQLQVISDRTCYAYGEEESVTRKISMDEFLLEILERTGGITRDKLVQATRIPRTTLYDNLSKLISQGKVTRKYIRIKKKRGRPKRTASPERISEGPESIYLLLFLFCFIIIEEIIILRPV